MARGLGAKVQNSLGTVPGLKFFSPWPFSGMNTQSSPTAIADQEFLYVENFHRLGDGKYRTAWDIGTALYTAPAPLKIVSFFFFTLGTVYYVAVFLSDGSAVQVNATDGAVTAIGPEATFYQSANGQLPACAQWGTIYLLISNRNTVNDYWAWDGTTLYAAGTAAPNGVNLLATGRKYTGNPTITAYGGHGSGMTFTPTVQAGGVVNVNIDNPGTGYEVGDVVQLAFSGGGSDTSAILTANLNSGTVAAANITAPGSGYTTASAAFSGGGGTGAAGTPIIGSGVSAIAITAGGTGYSTGAAVSFSGGGGSGAIASAITVGGVVTEIDVVDGGSGYTSAPTVTITGAGTGASATATIANGQIVGMTITNPGTGYTSAPAIVISGDGTGATAVAVLSPASVMGVTVTNPGSGFIYAPTITFVGGGGTGASGTVKLTPTKIAVVNIVSPGQNYQKVPSIKFVGGGGGSGATGMAVLGGGQVIAINLTNAGSGYTTNVEVIIQPQSGDTGTGAGAVALFVPTTIAGVQMANYGQNYTDAPAVEITPGANEAAYATVTMMPFGVSGAAIETYQSRAWLVNPQQQSYATQPPGGNFSVSAPGSFTDFATSDGGVFFTNSDGFLQTKYTGIRQSAGYLYLFGDGSVSVVSSVNTSGNPATTTFNYQNVDPQSGLSWRDSRQDFGRSLLIANEVGVFGLYGGAVTKISDKMNDVFTSAIFPATSGAVVPSSAIATIFDVKHYLLLMTIQDPDTGAFSNKMVTWNEKEWTVSSQTIGLTYIGQQKVESRFTAWGTDGAALYPMFARPSSALVKRMDTKIYGGGQAGFVVKEFFRFYIQAQDQSSDFEGVSIGVDFALSGQASQASDPDLRTVPSGVYPSDFFKPVVFPAPPPAWPVFGVGNGGFPFMSLGARLTTTSPDFIVSNFMIGYIELVAFQ